MRRVCIDSTSELHVRGCVAPTTTSRLHDEAWRLEIDVTNVCILKQYLILLIYRSLCLRGLGNGYCSKNEFHGGEETIRVGSSLMREWSLEDVCVGSLQLYFRKDLACMSSDHMHLLDHRSYAWVHAWYQWLAVVLQRAWSGSTDECHAF
jgi:hypothetical protein